MMSRSRWKVPLQCRRCFETGEAILSHQHDGPADIQVEFIAPGFRVIANDRTPDRVDVICEHCKVSARRDIHVRRKFAEILSREARKLLPKKLFQQERPRPQRGAAIVPR